MDGTLTGQLWYRVHRRRATGGTAPLPRPGVFGHNKACMHGLLQYLRPTRAAGRRRSSTALCREGWGYLVLVAAIFGLAVSRDVNLLFVLAGLLVGPLVFSWRLAVRTLDGLDVRRRVPHGICAGDLLVVNLDLSNPRRRTGSWTVVVQDQIQREGTTRPGEPLRPEVLFSYVPAGQSSTGVYRGRLPRRGRYRFGPLTLSTRFPFGLIRRTVVLEQPDALLVYPRPGRLTRRWVVRHREAFEGSQRREQRYGRMSGDFYGVRPWRQGDSRRWIHWRSSARHGTLVVRQFERFRSRDMAVLVDLWQPAEPAQPGLEHLENVELAVSFAATVVDDVCRRGSGDLWLGIAGRQRQWVTGPASGIVLQDAMETLALAEAASEDGLPELLDEALRQVGPGAEVVLVSTRPVDLRDGERFAAFQGNPAWRAMVGQIRLVNTAAEELADYFEAE